jgi:4-carboxymuconolactone decarboxylase
MNAGRHNGLIGPYIRCCAVPKLLQNVYDMGGYLRYEGPLKGRLTELVTLIAARHWTQQFEWNAHYPLALAAGLKQEIVTAIAEGRRPASMAEDEEIVYDFCTELNSNHSVSDATYARAVKKFGEQGVVDIAAVNGFYGMLAMIMNVARTPGFDEAGTSAGGSSSLEAHMKLNNAVAWSRAADREWRAIAQHR